MFQQHVIVDQHVSEAARVLIPDFISLGRKNPSHPVGMIPRCHEIGPLKTGPQKTDPRKNKNPEDIKIIAPSQLRGPLVIRSHSVFDEYIYIYMGVESKIGVKPPKSSIFNRVFHEINHPFWGTPIFGFHRVS